MYRHSLDTFSQRKSNLTEEPFVKENSDGGKLTSCSRGGDSEEFWRLLGGKKDD